MLVSFGQLHPPWLLFACCRVSICFFVLIFVNDIAKKDTVASARLPHSPVVFDCFFALFQQMEFCFLQLSAENRFFVTHLFRVVVFRVVVSIQNDKQPQSPRRRHRIAFLLPLQP